MWTTDSWMDQLSYRDTSLLQNLSLAAATQCHELKSIPRLKSHQPTLILTDIHLVEGENSIAFEEVNPNTRVQGGPLLREHGENRQTEDKVCWQARQSCMGQAP